MDNMRKCNKCGARGPSKTCGKCGAIKLSPWERWRLTVAVGAVVGVAIAVVAPLWVREIRAASDATGQPAAPRGTEHERSESHLRFARGILVERAEAKSSDYQGFNESIAMVEARVADLLRPCAPGQRVQECRADYRATHQEIGHRLDGLTHLAPLVFGPGSRVGLAIDNGYAIRQIFAAEWAEKDREYAECQYRGEGSCDQIVTSRNSYLWPFSQCMLVASCLASDQLHNNDAAIRAVVEAALERGALGGGDQDADQEREAISTALDTLYSPKSGVGDRLATCPGVDLKAKLERLCVDPTFKADMNEESKRARLCLDWRARYYDTVNFPAPTFCAKVEEQQQSPKKGRIRIRSGRPRW